MTLWPFLLLTFVYGCCVGSFLNVVIYRLAFRGEHPGGMLFLNRVRRLFGDKRDTPIDFESEHRPLRGLIYSFAYDLGSLSHPPSHCPKCEHKLRPWDNIPVLGWLLLGGKCRYCKVKISPQYPLIEAVCGLLFAGLFAVYFFTPLREGFEPIEVSWVVLLLHLFLVGGLLAASGIDAKHYIIPLSIPYAVFAVLLVGLPLAVVLTPDVLRAGDVPVVGFGRVPPILPQPAGYAFLSEVYPYPTTRWETGFGLCGAIGWLFSVLLMELGLIPRSFADDPATHDQPAGTEKPGDENEAAPDAKPAGRLLEDGTPDPDDPANWYAHPHPRREVAKELLFLAPPTVAAFVGAQTLAFAHSPAWLGTLGAALAGALVGAGLIWYIRVLGTMLFGKEAMGLGDVHLMLPIGAALGWLDVTIAFFVAPFSGILATALLPALSRFSKAIPKVLPYGPHLAIGAVVVLILRVPIFRLLGLLP